MIVISTPSTPGCDRTNEHWRKGEWQRRRTSSWGWSRVRGTGGGRLRTCRLARALSFDFCRFTLMGALSLGWFVKISVLEIYLTLWSTLSDYFLPPEGAVQASLTIIIIVIIIIIYNERDIIISSIIANHFFPSEGAVQAGLVPPGRRRERRRRGRSVILQNKQKQKDNIFSKFSKDDLSRL